MQKKVSKNKNILKFKTCNNASLISTFFLAMKNYSASLKVLMEIPNIPHCTNRKPKLVLGMQARDFSGSTSTFLTVSSKAQGKVNISIQQQVTKQEGEMGANRLQDYLPKTVNVKPSCWYSYLKLYI